MTTVSEFFQAAQPWVSASAPGRLDVMGGFADYSGSLVLQMPLRERTTVLAGFRHDDWVRIYSENFDAVFTLNLAPLRRIPIPMDAYRQARESLKLQENGPWAAYVVGCLLTLCFENKLFLRGIDFYVASNVPPGKGVSSSAALEVATLRAIEQLYRITLNGTLLPQLAQAAENHVAGAPCGLMDQLASHFGVPGRLLPIICQPDRLFEAVPELRGLRFFGIDSGAKHDLAAPQSPIPNPQSPNSYADVRCAAFMGYSILAETQGVVGKTLRGIRFGSGRSNLPWNGWLCNINKQFFEEKMLDLLPESLSGAAFLEHYGQTIDDATAVQPERNYPVRTATAHPIAENARVRAFYQWLTAAAADALEQNPLFRRQYLAQLGDLMYASHTAYSACGLGHAKTDLLVQMALEAGLPEEVYGAKITGGGSGGTVCFLAYGERGEASVRQIRERYMAATGEEAAFFRP